MLSRWAYKTRRSPLSQPHRQHLHLKSRSQVVLKLLSFPSLPSINTSNHEVPELLAVPSGGVLHPPRSTCLGCNGPRDRCLHCAKLRDCGHENVLPEHPWRHLNLLPGHCFYLGRQLQVYQCRFLLPTIPLHRCQ
jgi:hypothetical protein